MMNWQEIKLGQIVSISKGKKQEPCSDGKFRYINIEDLHNTSNRLYTNDIGVEVLENDLIIAWDGANAGKVGIGLKGIIGSTLARLQIQGNNVHPQYLFWVLESLNKTIVSQRTGATIPHINGSALRELTIPLPPLPIQKKIADILDAADSLKRKDQELLKKYDELAQAIFIDMFGDPVRNEKGWIEKSIRQTTDIVKNSIKAGPFGSSLKKEFYVSSGYKIYGQEQVIADSFEIGNYYINEKKYKELENCKISSGDVLISLVGTYGKISVVPDNFEPGIINPRLMKITLNRNIFNPRFFKYLLQTQEMISRIAQFSRGGTMDIVNVGIISEVLVITPPIELQNNFVLKLDKILLQKSAVAKNNKLDLCQSFIQKAFTGELVN